MSIHARADVLVCPETKLPLRPCRLEAAESVAGGGSPLTPRQTGRPAPFGATPTVLLRGDGGCAYPVVMGIPILMAPEMLLPPGRVRVFDLSDPRYAEAYEEMEHYNAAAEEEARDIRRSSAVRELVPVWEAADAQRASFPEPRAVWLDAVYDSAAQWDAYRHLGPVTGKRVLQLGGTGRHAVKFLCAGAEKAWLLTPMLAEALFALALARHFGVESRLCCVVAVAEELPFADGAFDAIYSGGCIHHMNLGDALHECARVLRPHGRFAAVEPWRAPFYGIGIRVFGKREAGVYCRPITRERARPFFDAFASARIVHHGTFTRYPLIALSRIGLRLHLPAVMRIYRWDDALCSLVPPLRQMGSSVALLGSRQPPSNSTGM